VVWRKDSMFACAGLPQYLPYSFMLHRTNISGIEILSKDATLSFS
jgi:hypothetical protein